MRILLHPDIQKHSTSQKARNKYAKKIWAVLLDYDCFVLGWVIEIGHSNLFSRVNGGLTR